MWRKIMYIGGFWREEGHERLFLKIQWILWPVKNKCIQISKSGIVFMSICLWTLCVCPGSDLQCHTLWIRMSWFDPVGKLSKEWLKKTSLRLFCIRNLTLVINTKNSIGLYGEEWVDDDHFQMLVSLKPVSWPGHVSGCPPMQHATDSEWILYSSLLPWLDSLECQNPGCGEKWSPASPAISLEQSLEGICVLRTLEDSWELVVNA